MVEYCNYFGKTEDNISFVLLFYNVVIIGNPSKLRSVIKQESNLLTLLAELRSCELMVNSIFNTEDPHVHCVATLSIVVWGSDGYSSSI